MQPARPAIAVISSYVARGAVGNRVMVPALEELSYDVWAVPTIVLPFHPGQGKGQRIVARDDAFAQMLDDLAKRDDADRAVCVISGYLGSARQAGAIADFVTQLRNRHEVTYLCDPVIGDHGGLYVPQNVAEAIANQLVPLATIITPNRYEHDWLTGQTCARRDDWLASSERLVTPTQIITSVPGVADDRIGNLAVDRLSGQALYCSHTRFDTVPSGTGDLFTAALSGLLCLQQTTLFEAVRIATAKVHRSVADSVNAKSSDLLIRKGYDMADQDTVTSILI